MNSNKHRLEQSERDLKHAILTRADSDILKLEMSFGDFRSFIASEVKEARKHGYNSGWSTRDKRKPVKYVCVHCKEVVDSQLGDTVSSEHTGSQRTSSELQEGGK